MRDDLIGFVLGALDADEHEQIRRNVEQDRELQRQLQLVQRCLQPLAGLRDDQEAPPRGLAARTCQKLLLVSDETVEPGPGAPAGPTWIALAAQLEAAQLEDVSSLETPRSEIADSDSAVSEPSGASPWGSDRLGSEGEYRSWTMADFVVAAGVCLAASCLFFPALINSRWHSQVAGCQNNFRQLGTALIDYSMGTDGYFPAIPPAGNLSFSGVFAAKLTAKGLAPDRRVFLCPAKGNTVTVLEIPPLSDIAAAQGPRLVNLHRTMGGDYAYTLGYVKQGHLYGIRNRGRENVAILADAPLENLRNVSIGTHGRGQNVLYEDGHLGYQVSRRRPGVPHDDIFFNDQGQVSAGLHADDAVLGASHVSPFPTVEPGELNRVNSTVVDSADRR